MANRVRALSSRLVTRAFIPRQKSDYGSIKSSVRRSELLDFLSRSNRFAHSFSFPFSSMDNGNSDLLLDYNFSIEVPTLELYKRGIQNNHDLLTKTVFRES